MPLTYVSLAQLLKSDTLLQHEAAEEILFPRLNNIATIKDYADILKTFYGFYAPLEKLISEYITAIHLPDIRERKNTWLIIDDLLDLGENVFELKICHTLPQIENVSQAFGALYVMEGSTLGGRMIQKMLLKNHPGMLQPKHLSFFNGYGDATSAKWKSFLESLENIEDRSTVVAAANETFTLFQNWIKQRLYDEQDRTQ
jgi:heme oxygenase (biliverdin-IX-beta and delta-forming)